METKRRTIGETPQLSITCEKLLSAAAHKALPSTLLPPHHQMSQVAVFCSCSEDLRAGEERSLIVKIAAPFVAHQNPSLICSRSGRLFPSKPGSVR